MLEWFFILVFIFIALVKIGTLNGWLIEKSSNGLSSYSSNNVDNNEWESNSGWNNPLSTYNKYNNDN